MKKVLLIDDDKFSNFLNKKIVELSGLFFTPEMCENALDALDFLKNTALEPDKKPEIIFLDIQMPIMDGFEFLIEFEKLPKEIIDGIEIVMVTSSLLETDKTRAFEYNFVIDFINKPLTKDKLLAIEKKLTKS